MARKRFKPEQIIHMLREAEIRLAGGSTAGEVCRALGIWTDPGFPDMSGLF